ncbi:MAG: uracil-DNA glycosylase [Proteobacteria bacterium]|nr:uracil-DNA glycosylase [Pseudomonadota bacterium]
MDLGQVGTLEELRAAVEGFHGCALREGAQRTVFSDGNPAAEIMLIGEAPGAEEDRQGKPFVGRSGQLLDKMLLAIGLDRKSVYITNTIFWRPPDNRTPTPAETLSCRPFLLRHIALVKPKIIVLVGGTAVKSVLQTTDGIGKYRKRWMGFEVPGLAEPVAMMATFHPAYLLRNPPAKTDAWEDLKMLKKKAVELGVMEEEMVQ